MKCTDEDLDVTAMFIPLSHRLEVRAQVVQAFLGKFQLATEEMATLRGARDAPITEVIGNIKHYFFNTLLCSSCNPDFSFYLPFNSLGFL